MAERIQRVPVAFLDALGLIGSGANPDVVLNEVQGSVEMLELYLARLISNEATSSALTAVGDVADITVPDGQVWDLVSVQGGVSITTGSVGSGSEFGIGVVVDNAFIRLFTHSTTPSAVGAGERSEGGAMVPKRIMLPPGTIVRTRFDQASGSPVLTDVSITVGVLFHRLRV